MSDSEPSESNNPIGISNVDEFSKKVLGTLMSTIKSGNTLPSAGDDFDLYSSFSGFRNFNHERGSQITEMIDSFLLHQGLKRMPSIDSKQQQSTATAVDDKFDYLVEANDMMLEQISGLLDDVNNASKRKDSEMEEPKKTEQTTPTIAATSKPIISSWNRRNKYGKQQTFRLFHAQNIERPQLKFKDKIDNSNMPFVPKLTEKPNSITPLPQALVDLHRQNMDSDIPLAIAHLVRQGRTYNSENQSIYEHPYETELNSLQFMDAQMQRVTPEKYWDFPNEPCKVITEKGELCEAIHHMKEFSEIAVDLEHHSYRSFQGITCLMQISSRTRDFLIDTLTLRSEIHLLNEIFTDPKIVKVFHGANSDIQWLQRDFGVYVVNMFDTSQASRELGLARFSLDFLLQKYCGVHADKKYQLADWRIRPLPTEMRKYAQEDTHYLLYIYDMMKNELLDKGGQSPGGGRESLMNVLNRSRDICLIKYEKFLINQNSYLELYEKQHRKQLNENQLELLSLLFSWRDAISRQEDESTGYVLPKHMLFQIAEIMPREAQGVLACCNPVPPLVRQHVHTIHQLVLEARAKSFAGKTGDLRQKNVQVPVPAQPEMETYGDLLTCPHDTSHDHEPQRLDHGPVLTFPVNSKSSFYKSFPNQHTIQRNALSNENGHFLKFFPNTNQETSRKTNTPAPTQDEGFQLSSVLEPGFVWKLRNLEPNKNNSKSKEQKLLKQKKQEVEELIVLKSLPDPVSAKRLLGGHENSSGQKKKKYKSPRANLVDSDFKAHNYDRFHYNRFQKK